MQQEQDQDQELKNPSGIKELKINSILNNDVTKFDGISSDGVLKSDNDDSEDGDDNDGNSDRKDGGGKTEEEVEEADFVSWFGSLKEDEAVSPKEEAVQVRTPPETLLHCTPHCCLLLSMICFNCREARKVPMVTKQIIQFL